MPQLELDTTVHCSAAAPVRHFSSIRNDAPAESLRPFDKNFIFSFKVSETKMSVFSLVNKIISRQFAGSKTVKRTNQEMIKKIRQEKW